MQQHMSANAAKNMSLSAILEKNVVNTVPDALLEKCDKDDRTVVENVLLVAQAAIESLNLSSASVTLKNKSIHLYVPICGTNVSVSLHDLQCIQTSCPARVADLKVQCQVNQCLLVVVITDGTSKIQTDQIEVVRIAKKRRFV